MKTILIPTDFSQTSKNAIRYAVDFFQDIKVPYKIFLLHAYQVSFETNTSQMIEANDTVKVKVKESLENERKWTLDLSKNSKLEVCTIPHMGSLENVIPQVLKDNKIDLIVIGKNGGEHAEQISKVLKHNKSMSPLLVVFS